jgi:hypothetical protein
MSGILIGNISKRNGASYTARVAFGANHYDHLRDASGTSELKLNPDIGYDPLNSNLNASQLHLEFKESFEQLTAYVADARPLAFSMQVEAINGSKVEAQDYNFPIGKLIYMSDRPIVQNMNFDERSGLSLIGGDSAGTYTLIEKKGESGGADLYWSSDPIDVSLAKLELDNPSMPLEPTGITITRVGGTDFFKTSVTIENDRLQQVNSVEVIFDNYSGPEPIPTELPILSFLLSGNSKIFSNEDLTFDDPNSAVTESYDVIVNLLNSSGNVIKSAPFTVVVG